MRCVQRKNPMPSGASRIYPRLILLLIALLLRAPSPSYAQQTPTPGPTVDPQLLGSPLAFSQDGSLLVSSYNDGDDAMVVLRDTITRKNLRIWRHGAIEKPTIGSGEVYANDVHGAAITADN